MSSRLHNTIKSATVGLGVQALSLVLQFATRTALIWGLGEYYLGLNSVMTSLLGILSLAELGMGNAVIYSLYKPISSKDSGKIEAYLMLYKKVYRIIGAIIMVLSFAIVPALPYLVNTEMTSEVYAIYFTFVLNTALGYWLLNYRTALFQATQKRYLISVTDLVSTVISSIGQILAFAMLHNYLIGLLIMTIALLCRSGVILLISRKHYRFLHFSSKAKLLREDKETLFKNVYAMFIGKLSDTASASVPTLVISSFVSLAASGFYSNYTMITSGISLFMREIFGSVTPSVGNLNVEETIEQKIKIYDMLNFISFCIFAISGTICFATMNKFIEIWAGPEYVLDLWCVGGFCFNILTIGLLQATIIYKDSCGIFFPGRFRPFISCLITIILSLSLVRPFGITGVIWALPLTRLLTANWYDPYLVYKLVFNTKPFRFYGTCMLRMFIAIGLGLLSYWVCSILPLQSWLNFVVSVLVSGCLTTLGIFCLYRKTSVFESCLQLARGQILGRQRP